MREYLYSTSEQSGGCIINADQLYAKKYASSQIVDQLYYVANLATTAHLLRN